MARVVDDSANDSRDRLYDMIRVLCKQRLGLNICHINAQSLNCKMDEFRFLFENSGVDVVCVSETWFDPEVFSSIFNLSNFSLFRCDRRSHGGGVALYVRNGITCRKCFHSELGEQVEYIFVEVSSVLNKVLIGCVYRPNRLINTNVFLTKVSDLTLNYEEVVICGDFNSNILSESHLVNDMEAIGLFPVNSLIPTHYTATRDTLIDIIFVSNRGKVLLYDQLSASCFSKHDLLFVSMDYQFHTYQNIEQFYDFKNLDYDLLHMEIRRIDWNSIYFMTSVEEQLDFFENNLNSMLETCVPVKTITIGNRTKPWFDNDIKRAIRKRDLLFKRWKRFRTVELHVEYCIARRIVNRMIKSAKSSYYSSVFASAIGSKKTWRTIRNIGINKGNVMQTDTVDIEALNEKFTSLPNVPIHQSFYQDQMHFPESAEFNFECVNQRDVFFSCLAIKSNAVGTDKIQPKFVRILLPFLLPYITFIFNTIITKCVFPKNWKYAKIIPVPKASNDYRPIAILPYLSKVFEKLIHEQIYKFLNDNGLLTERQSGFRPKRSCTTALLEVSEEIRGYIDQGDIAFLVLLDHSKAFDMVHHAMLCLKLRHLFNFSHTSTSLLSSYLADRHQSVYCKNQFSRPLYVSKGVPQGSILGPLLFTIYINDLIKILSFCRVHLYADDIQIYLNSKRDNIDQCVYRLNEDLKSVYNWADANGLCINSTKSKCLVITPRFMKLPEQPLVCWDNQRIEIVRTTKNLGIIFNNNLTWMDHVNYASGRTFSMLRSLWKTQYFTPFRVRILLAKTYLLPVLLYGCEIFASCDSASIRKLNVAYNAVVRYVYGLSRYDRVSTFGKTLYGVSFDDLLKIRVLVQLHRIINTREPKYLFERISFVRSQRLNDMLQIRHRTLISEWQFFIYSIRLWNSLPTRTKQLSNALQFKRALFNYYS